MRNWVHDRYLRQMHPVISSVTTFPRGEDSTTSTGLQRHGLLSTRDGGLDWHRDLPTAREGYSTDPLTAEAVRSMSANRPASRCSYVPYNAVLPHCKLLKHI